ncbi:hypothetical protein AVEN_270016-1 [Araneus ventricosus]|uniref:Uncharacterized protein n=1 Tax=Araneus ventricosus TaxID=182803 RepID=A0A4Y2H1H9_ARAVE|nr:hypothetical protein AVEN_270016-1 [Araneus ventricosus]
MDILYVKKFERRPLPMVPTSDCPRDHGTTLSLLPFMLSVCGLRLTAHRSGLTRYKSGIISGGKAKLVAQTLPKLNVQRSVNRCHLQVKFLTSIRKGGNTT